MRKLISLLMALAIVLSLAVGASAASVTYRDKGVFGFQPGSVYSDTDLFDNFKGVMPGDERTEWITITNEARKCSYIKVYMRAVAHDEQTNPLSPEVGKEESVASMEDFLSNMWLRVETGDGTQIFADMPQETGSLTDWTYLGQVYPGKSIQLKAVLNVSDEMGNAYQFREGEVDWEFQVVEYVNDAPKTGDDTEIWPYVAMLTVCMAGMMFLLVARKKKKA